MDSYRGVELIYPTILILTVIIAIVIYLVIIYFIPLGLWLESYSASDPVSLARLFQMKLKRVNPYIVDRAFVKARKADLPLTLDELETHCLIGGDVERVVNALIKAGRTGAQLSFERACAVDIAGLDALTEEAGLKRFF
jgi:uncharacterized protein YqfA (UPF0365 family)